MITENEIIDFTRKKSYVLKKHIDDGGTGQTVLIYDELLDTDFVCKKYSPIPINDTEECFDRFIEEIKILYKLSHENIVKFYNYYLYPENKVGYIIMESIEGDSIDKHLYGEDIQVFENIFVQLIDGFEYLEKMSILHRDIKAPNILVTNSGSVKIIDFGFGKNNAVNSTEKASVFLNWPVSEMPEEISEGKYTHQSDIFFLGKMFKRLLVENNISEFKYQDVLEKMVTYSKSSRYDSFIDIRKRLSTNIEVTFSDKDKSIYTAFADPLLTSIYNYIDSKPLYNSDIEDIIYKLKEVINSHLLEVNIQDNHKLVECFLVGNINCDTDTFITLSSVQTFYNFVTSKPYNIQRIILDNIQSRLSSVTVHYSQFVPIVDDDDIPF